MKKYEKPEIDVIEFCNTSVITESNGDGAFELKEDEFI